MNHEDAAARLCALGNPSRLAIYRLLINAGTKGLPVGEIQRELEIPASTLSHHISRLVSVGLLKQERSSRILYCTPSYEMLNDLLAYLQVECCSASSVDYIISSEQYTEA